MNKTSEGVAMDIDRQYRICCLTTKPSCPLMWGHYAEKHSGVCLEFKVRNETFCGALKVEYEENYPPFQLTDDSAEDNIKVLTTKSQDWANEEEYRLIALENNTNLPIANMLVTNNGLLVIPEGSLNSIIVGCMMPEEDRKELTRFSHSTS